MKDTLPSGRDAAIWTTSVSLSVYVTESPLDNLPGLREIEIGKAFERPFLVRTKTYPFSVPSGT